MQSLNWLRKAVRKKNPVKLQICELEKYIFGFHFLASVVSAVETTKLDAKKAIRWQMTMMRQF
jgi:hypothetical protein